MTFAPAASAAKAGRAACAAAADDQHVGGGELRPGDVVVVDQRIALQDARDVRLTRVAAICADLQRDAGVVAVIRMIAGSNAASSSTPGGSPAPPAAR